MYLAGLFPMFSLTEQLKLPLNPLGVIPPRTSLPMNPLYNTCTSVWATALRHSTYWSLITSTWLIQYVYPTALNSFVSGALSELPILTQSKITPLATKSSSTNVVKRVQIM